MNITLEQVEKLKTHANVSYEEAKAALESSKGDLLEAMIYLEKQGKVASNSVHAFNSQNDGPKKVQPESNADQTANTDSNTYQAAPNQYYEQYQKGQQSGAESSGPTFSDHIKKFWDFVCRWLHKGNINHFEVHRQGRSVLSIPVNILILCIIFLFWITIPLLIIGLFFSCRYNFKGPDLGRDSINNAMNTASDTADSIKRSVKEEANNTHAHNNNANNNAQ